jgi:hypothetical protein
MNRPSPPAYRRDTCEGLLRAKLDYLRFGIGERALVTLGLTRAQWEGRFNQISIAAAWGLEIELRGHANIRTEVSRKLGGHRLIRTSELQRLAAHLDLTAALGQVDAAYSLTDDWLFDIFRQELIDAGWTDAGAGAAARPRSRALILQAFSRFDVRRGGIRLDESPLEPAMIVRGMRPGRPDDLEKINDIPLKSPMRFALEDLTHPRGLVLLEIGPRGTEAGVYPVTALVPSTSIPEAKVRPAQVLPDPAVEPFFADPPVGAYDWLAILTPAPLSLPWRAEGLDPHRLSQRELDGLLQILAEIAKSRPGDVEVRHHRFTIGMA